MPTLFTEQALFPHKGNKIITMDREISIVARIEEPCVVLLGNVLSDYECDHLIHLAKNQMNRSKIGASGTITNIRTSRSTFLPEDASEIVTQIEERLAHIMGIPFEHGEGLQLLNYQVGQEYKAHLDFFSSGSKQVANPRISTLVMYLSDVEQGGETYFPHLNFSVTPQKGMAVYFEYFYENQDLNEQTLHGSSPVIIGDKWAATQWMHRQQFKIR